MSKRVSLAELSPLVVEALQSGGAVTIAVTGNSMLPMLRHRRDKVVLVKPGGAGLGKYDIPLFVRADGKFVLHRIVARGKKGYIVTGDNQCTREYPVEPSQIIGVVEGFWRNGVYINCCSSWYRLYCRVWVFTYPLRWVYLRGMRLLRRIV